MSKVLIGSLIDEINALLSRPVGSVSKKVSPDMIHHREQLKQLRSHLENLTDDTHIGNIDQQYQTLVIRLQGSHLQGGQYTDTTNANLPTNTQAPRTDKLETLPTPLVSPLVSNSFGAATDLIKETSTMPNSTPEPNSTFVNDRMIAALQQAIQQTLQQVVKESVQLSVQQVVSQTLAVERALMVGEISASINKIVESQQRSQISQELVTLNQQKQKLNSEISQLESDRAAWMQHFQEFQSSQQASLDHSLRSVNTYLQDQIRDQITDTVQQTVQQTVTGTVNQTVAQTIQETLQENLVNLPAIAVHPNNEAQREQEFVNKVQEQTDRFLSHLDEMFSSTFRSLEQDIQEYQTSIEAKLGHIENLEQKGEALINALVDRISQQHEPVIISTSESGSNSANILLELPDDIPPQYLEIASEPADENLIEALLAGNEFGETIAEPIEQIVEQIVEILPSDTLDNDHDPKIDDNNAQDENSEITEIESILGASSDTLFEDAVESSAQGFDLFTDSDLDNSYLESSILNDSSSLNPDFDLEAETQIVDQFNPDFDLEAATQIVDQFNPDFDLESETQIVDSFNDSLSASDDPELLQWLEESSNRPSPTSNIADISPDQELLSWLGNDALDMAKLPTQTRIPVSTTIANPEIDNNSSILNSITSIKNDSTNESRNNKIQDDSANNQVEQLFGNSFSDQADDSEESLILLTSKNVDNTALPAWEDSLINELSLDLEKLEFGNPTDTNIAANLDQFIRNTPYALTDWDTQESQAYPTIIDVIPQSSTETNSLHDSVAIANISDIPDIIENPDNLFVDQSANNVEQELNKLQLKQSNEKAEIVINFEDLQVSPFSSQSNEIPEIFDHPESLFDPSVNDSVNDFINDQEQGESADDMDAIFADVIAANAAKYNVSTPFDTNDEIDQLFADSDKAREVSANIGLVVETDESELDTLLFGFDPATEIEHTFVDNLDHLRGSNDDLGVAVNSDTDNFNELDELDTVMQSWQPDDYEELDAGAKTMKEVLRSSEPIEIIEELDTILQGFANPEIPVVNSSADETNFVAIEEFATVIENPVINPSQNTQSQNDQDNEWSIALEQLESQLIQPQLVIENQNIPEVGELSADEFFASLEYAKINNVADRVNDVDEPMSFNSTKAFDISDLDNLSASEDDLEDLLLNEFADSQNQFIDNDWDHLLDDLNSFNFNEPLLDDRREKLGLSSVAPITDILDNVLDIDSLVIESRTASLVPAPPEKEVYSLDHTWILGVDIGSTAIRTSLFNANTGKVYSLYLDTEDEMSCKLVWHEDHSLDDPIVKEIRVLIKKSPNAGLETGEVAITHFKQFLKLGLPYRGVSTWQPIIQWSDGHQSSLRWLISALKNLLEQIQTRANHPKLPDLGLILLKLSGVVFGYPANWSDTYILNVREAILKSGLVNQAEQVMAVEQAIAPVLSLMHDHKISQEITLLIDSGAVTTSLCLIKEVLNIKDLDRSKLHIRNLDYAGISLSQDIIVQLFYPHWQLITNPNRHLCKFDHLSLPETGAEATQQRLLLQQYLLSSAIGQQMLELADRVKVTFGRDMNIDSWNEDLMGQPIVVVRRELENLILQPFIHRINRELNAVISNAGILGEDVQQVLLLGSTMHIPLLSRWLTQKLPNAKIDPLGTSILANGLAVAPLYPHLHDVARQQYSDYFLLQEICRLNLTQSVNPNQLLKQLQMRGVNTKACRDRILSILQGDLPEGLFPWQEPEGVAVLEDPTLSGELFAGRLFELETDGTYQPNVTKFQQLRVYLQAIIGNMTQTLNEPLVFPEVKV